VTLKITDVAVDLVTLPAQPPFRWRDGNPGSEGPVAGGILRIRTDEGIEGVARCRRGRILADIAERRFGELAGRDPLQREQIWEWMWNTDRIEEFPVYVFPLVDLALWDIAGKAAGVPVYQLFGGFRDAIPSYASTVTFGSIEEYLDVADQCLGLGYPAIKLHGWGHARPDARLCTRLREHVGDDVPLMYDGSAAFDLPDAVYLGHALADAGYTWYEEPIREFSVTAYRLLAERVRVPLLVAETSDGSHMNTADFVVTGCAEYVRTSAQFKGGFTGALRIAHLADAYRLRAEVHGPGRPSRHLCMAIPNTTWYESLVLSNPVRREACVDGRGLVHAPTEPGIGWDEAPDPP